MIKAMDYAVQGMQQATSQANDAAQRILQDTSSSFTPPEQTATPNTTGNTTGPVQTSTRDLVAPSTDNLINDIVDLKMAVLNFKANAAVYKRVADMSDELINNFAKNA